MDKNKLYQGEVKTFKVSYGFIESKDFDKDIFCHSSSVEGKRLDRGDIVEFKIVENSRGFKTSWCRVVED